MVIVLPTHCTLTLGMKSSARPVSPDTSCHINTIMWTWHRSADIIKSMSIGASHAVCYVHFMFFFMNKIVRIIRAWSSSNNNMWVRPDFAMSNIRWSRFKGTETILWINDAGQDTVPRRSHRDKTKDNCNIRVLQWKQFWEVRNMKKESDSDTASFNLYQDCKGSCGKILRIAVILNNE